MAQLLKPGQKVKYTHAGKEQTGIIHGVKTHEDEKGTITRVAYLIDTGNTVREDIGAEPTGKQIKHPDPEVDELVPEMKEVIVKQPEQIEIDQNFVKLA